MPGQRTAATRGKGDRPARVPREPAPLEGPTSTIVSRFSLSLGPESGCNLRDLSVAYPHHRIDMVSNLPKSRDEVIYDLRITAERIGDELLKDLREVPTVRSVELLRQTPTVLDVRLLAGICPIVDIHRELEIAQRFPYSMENGAINLLVIASEAKTRVIYARLQGLSPKVQISSIRRDLGSEEDGLLTSRQQEIFRMALQSGYWDVPRRATLADLARRTGVAKSTLSESLAIIEKKLLEESFKRRRLSGEL